MSEQLDAFMDILESNGTASLHDLRQESAGDAYRTTSALLDGPVPAVASVVDVLLRPTPDDQILARVYTPDPGRRLPLVVYFHGISYSSGGWVVPSLDGGDALCRHMAIRAEAVVVSVGYRLGHEYRYPVPLEDCQAVAEWTIEHAGPLGSRRDALAIAGTGFGAGLATVVARKLRAVGTDIAGQVLLCPMTDAMMASESYSANANGPYLTAQAVRDYWEQYLPATVARDDPDVSPLSARDLGDLAPTLIVTAGLDPLRDEGLAYAKRLEDAGNRVVVRDFPDMIHDFVRFPNRFDVAHEAIADVGAFLGTVFDA